MTYRDAVLGGTVNVNGVEFATQRTPQPGSGPVPGANDESSISVLNYVEPTQADGVTLSLDALGADLFTRYTVPVGETIDGTFVANATVELRQATIQLGGPGLLDSVALPAATGALENAFFSVSLELLATFDGGLRQTSFVDGTGGAGDYSFSVTPVPLPPAAVLLGSAFGLLGARRRAAVCPR